MSFDQQIKEFGVVRIPGGASDSELAAAIAAEAATRSAADAAEAIRVQTVLLGGTGATTAGGALANLGAASASDLAAEAALARNASNLTSGSLPDARLTWPNTIPASNTTAGSNSDRWIGPGSGSATGIQVNMPTGGTGYLSVNGSNAAGWALGKFYASAIQAFGSASFTLSCSTADGSDSASAAITGGGAIIAPGTSQTRGSGLESAGNEHATRPGQLSLMAGGVTGGKVVAYDKDAAIQFQVSEAGIKANTISAFGATLTQGATNFSGQILLDSIGPYSGSVVYIGISNSGSYGAHGSWNQYRSAGSVSYPGAHQSYAPLTTRAASTAIGLCPVATGDMAEVKISETQYAGAKVFVDAAGTVTLYSPIYGTVNAAYVNSSSPGAAEIGVYISAGVLYFKGGSSYAGKMASFSQIGKA